MKLVLAVELPDELLHEFMQHLRDFDAFNPGCTFLISGETKLSTEEMLEALKLDPPLPHMWTGRKQ